MLLNAINSKVNLPALVSKLGGNTSNFEFINLPVYGWFAKSKESDFVGNLMDFFAPGDWLKLYSRLCTDFADCLDYKLAYSERTEKQLFDEQRDAGLIKACWGIAKQEIHTVIKKGMVYKNYLEQQGMPRLIDNGVGYLSEKALEVLPKELAQKLSVLGSRALMIPSFHTPKHIASVDVFKPSEVLTRTPVYKTGEVGWYGQLGHVVKDFNELKYVKGCTWNYKCDYWHAGPVTLSDQLSVEQTLRIWSEAERTVFTQDLPALLLGKVGTADLTQHVGGLTYHQVRRLEGLTGTPLVPAWYKTREQQYTVQGKTYLRRGGAYFLVGRRGEEEQLTNFVIDIHQVKKLENGEYGWVGLICCDDHIVPIELEDKYLSSNYLFSRGIRKAFLSAGIGIPLINNTHIPALLTMIQLNCHGLKAASS